MAFESDLATPLEELSKENKSDTLENPSKKVKIDVSAIPKDGHLLHLEETTMAKDWFNALSSEFKKAYFIKVFVFPVIKA